jgi:hypothetical protein
MQTKHLQFRIPVLLVVRKNNDTLVEQVEIFLTRKTSGTKIIFDDEYRDFIPIGNDNRPWYSLFYIDKVISFSSDTDEAGVSSIFLSFLAGIGVSRSINATR